MQSFSLSKPLLLILLFLTVCIFWVVVNSFDVYTYAVTGAIFEILSIPMLLMLAVIPTVSLYFWYRDKFSIKSWFLYIGVLTPTFTTILFNYFFQ